MTQYYDIPDFPQMEAKNIEGLPPIPLNNKMWEEWMPEVEQHRIRVREETESSWSGQKDARIREILRVAKDGRYWLSTYGAIYNAAPDEENEESDDWITDTQSTGYAIGFIPYVFQLYVWDHQVRAFRTRGPKGDTAYCKSRQMGLSNIMCGIYSWAWMAKTPFQGRLLSRKEDLVDDANNPDSLFWKIRLQLKAQPKWLLQAFAPGFSWIKHHGYNLDAAITNPINNNHLGGESTNATAGRGPTATGILLDEYAFMRGGYGIWTATRAASRHRTAVSTVNLAFGSHFWDLMVGKPEDEAPARLFIPYWLHPYHDEAWLEQERKRDTEAGINTEVLMDWYGSESDFVYPTLRNKQVGDYPYVPFGGPVFIAIDDGWSGYWAFHIVQWVTAENRLRIVDSYRNSHKPVDFYGGLFRGQYLDGFDYGDHEHQIVRLMRMLQNPIFVMDTHGKHVEQVAGMSVIERLATKWSIYANVDYENREYKDRWQYTSDILNILDWNDTPRVRTSLLSCQRYRWKAIDDTTEIVTEYREPIKNNDSHDATALEYFATNWYMFKMIYVPGGRINYGG